MAKCGAAEARRSSNRPVPFPPEDRELEHAFLRLRAVLVMISTAHGGKGAAAANCTQALQDRGIPCSPRTLGRWCWLYKRRGFAGLSRQRRADAGRPRRISGDVFLSLVNAAARLRRPGDLTREFRKLQPGTIPYRTFVFWVRRLQAELPLEVRGAK